MQNRVANKAKMLTVMRKVRLVADALLPLPMLLQSLRAKAVLLDYVEGAEVAWLACVCNGRCAMMYADDGAFLSCCWMLTNVVTVNGGTGGLEAKTNVLVPSAVAGGLASSLGVLEDGLLLESLFGLDTELNVRHDGRMYGEERGWVRSDRS